MKAILTEPSAEGAVIMGQATEPKPCANEVLIRVTAFSINRGEINFAKERVRGSQIGWDVAGIVDQAAADGSGPEIGARVVGFVRAANGWAEYVTIPVRDLTVIPEGVSDTDAATLPVAGLTALYTLERGDRLLASRVLITGASGGVGLFAVQLARLMGAQVIAQVRKTEQIPILERAGAAQVVVDAKGAKLMQYGPYRLIVDGVGGDLLAHAIPTLSEDGVAVLYGITSGPEAVLPIGFMIGTGRGRIEGFNLYRESEDEAISKGLNRLLGLVQGGLLNTHVEVEDDWSGVSKIAADLLHRKFSGKAVLHVSG